MGGNDVRLLDLSRRGLLVETGSRLAIGAKTTIRIATMEGIVYVRGLVVRSRVVGIGTGIVFHTALALEEDLALADTLARERAVREEILHDEILNGDDESPAPMAMSMSMTMTDAEAGEAGSRSEEIDAGTGRLDTREPDFEIISLDALRGGDDDDGDAVQYALFETSDFFTPPPGEPESLDLTITLPQSLEELHHRAAERGDEI